MILCIITKLLFIFCVCVLSRVRLFATPWTVAHQAPLSMGLSRQAYWSGLSCHPPEELPDPGTEPSSLVCCTCRRVLCHCATWEATQSYRRPPSFGCPPFPTAFSVFIVLFLEQIHEPLTSPHPPRHMMAPEPWMQRLKPPFLPHTDSLIKTLGEHINSTQ